MIVTATCHYCKEKIDLNKDNFTQLNFPLQKREIYFHFPLCLVNSMFPNPLESPCQHAPAPSHAPRPRARR
jgi:hypothetical protein